RTRWESPRRMALRQQSGEDDEERTCCDNGETEESLHGKCDDAGGGRGDERPILWRCAAPRPHTGGYKSHDDDQKRGRAQSALRGEDVQKLIVGARRCRVSLLAPVRQRSMRTEPQSKRIRPAADQRPIEKHLPCRTPDRIPTAAVEQSADALSS